MQRIIVGISFVASILTIADMVYKIFVGANYNFYSSIIWLFIIIAVQVSLSILLEIRIDKKDIYIVILYFLFIPVVIMASSWGYYNYAKDSENKYSIDASSLKNFIIKMMPEKLYMTQG